MNHANSFNQVILVGRIGFDPELKETKGKNPTKFVKFSVATYKKFPNGKKITTWHRINFWGPKQSEWAVKWLKKGMLVQINGELSTRKYTTRDGEERMITDVRAYEIIMYANPKRMEGEEQRPEEADPETASQDRQAPPEDKVEDKEEDIY